MIAKNISTEDTKAKPNQHLRNDIKTPQNFKELVSLKKKLKDAPQTCPKKLQINQSRVDLPFEVLQMYHIAPLCL